MADSVSITIKISDRSYPLRVKPEEEALLREAALQINQRLGKRKQKLGSLNIQDLLSMTAFDLMVNSLKDSNRNEQMAHQLDVIDSLIDQVGTESS